MNKNKIPELKSKKDLVNRLFVHFLGNFWGVLDKESRNYFHLMMVLIDKSIYEYNNFYGYVEKELKENDPLSYRLKIIWHLENCINAVSRASKILRTILIGVKGQKKAKDISKLLKQNIVKKLEESKIFEIRNRVEHIDEDIFNSLLKGPFLVSLDENYANIVINENGIALNDFVLLIDSFYDLLVDINNQLPNRIENGVYYYDKE